MLSKKIYNKKYIFLKTIEREICKNTFIKKKEEKHIKKKYENLLNVLELLLEKLKIYIHTQLHTQLF